MDPGLHERARRHGVQLSFKDAGGRRRRASEATVRGVLDALVDEAAADRLIEPVVVAWDGKPVAVLDSSPRRLDCTVVNENGTASEWTVREGEQVTLPSLPLGYHTLECDDGSSSHRARIISAPRHAPVPTDRLWGIFLPLYALRTAHSWGIGDFTDLGALVEWVRSSGGDFVATLPMLASFLDEPFDPSPYAPVSRLFWNEMYVDVERTPESAAATPETDRAEIARLSDLVLVDYRAAYALKRRVLELLAESFFATESRRGQIDRFLAAQPHAEAYARFRAKTEGEDAYRLHLYAQFVADEQLTELGRELELDLPVGVHADGFDVAHFDVFARGASAGAPPDGFFEGGQNWGFPPLHPVRSREEGHAYFAESIRTLARRARVVRIDHVMALNRLYWIPDGAPATEGTYVRYPADELYAIVTLEAHRNNAAIVGEDLGTVPAEVRAAMRRHHVLRSYVLQFEASGDEITPVPVDVLASLNTHDTPTFAQFSRDHPGISLRRAIEFLAVSPARAVAVNLEDLWGEDRPQNVPGTSTDEQPNWQRKAALTFEEFRDKREVTQALGLVDNLRKR